MRVTGSLLFIAGIIVALICAAKLPAIEESWSDMHFLYGGGVALSLVGLLLFNLHHTSQHKCSSSKHTCSGGMALLQGLLVEMRHLGRDIDNLDGMKIATRITVLLDKYVLPFASVQQELLLMLGQNQCVKVLVTIAQSERLLNRMWSAASDGYVNEAIATYPKALAEIEEAYSVCRRGTGNGKESELKI
jgi:hypothetical protein